MTARRLPGGFVVRRKADGRSPVQREFMRRFRRVALLGSLPSFGVLLLAAPGPGHETEPVGGPGCRGPRHEQTPDQDRYGPVQISPDVRENGREIRRLMEQARSEGAAIVHFPESGHVRLLQGPDQGAGTRSIGTPSSTSCERPRTWPGSWGCGLSWAVATGSLRRTGRTTASTLSPTGARWPRGTTSGSCPTPRSLTGTPRAGSPACSRWRAGGSAASCASRSNSRSCSSGTRSWRWTASCSRPMPTNRCSASRPRATPRRTATGSASLRRAMSRGLRAG